MRIVIGCDHAGYSLKEKLKDHLSGKGFEVIDEGSYSDGPVDYPDYAHAVANRVITDGLQGVLICGSANGVAISANKHKGVRAAICWNEETARLARQHNDANIICLPARFVDDSMAIKMTDIFLSTGFEGGRHQNRVQKIDC